MHPTIRLALTLALSAAATPLLAQQTALSRSAPDAMVTVLDSTALRDGRGRTLADFLAGRVPGLQVAYESGQPSAAPRIVSRSAYGTLADPEPLLYVDGVLWRDDPNWSASDSTWRPPSFGWQMPVEEIEEVRVHLGASSTGMLEFGGSRGAVLVTTRRARGGELRVRAGAQVSSASYSQQRQTVVGRTFSAGSVFPSWGCTLGREADGQCTPNAAASVSAFDLFSLHQGATGVSANVDASGTALGTAFRASVTRGDVGGTLPSSDRSMTSLSLALARAFGPRFDVSMDVRAGTFAAGMGDRMLYGFFLGPILSSPYEPDSSVARMQQARDFTDRLIPGRTGDRVTIATRGTMRLGAATTLSARASTDEIWRAHRSAFESGPSLTPVRMGGAFEGTTSNVGLAIEHGRDLRWGLRADLLASVSITNTALRDEWYSEQFDPMFGWLGSRRVERSDPHLRSAVGGLRLARGSRWSAAASVRHEDTKDGTLAPSLLGFNGQYALLDGTSGGLGLSAFGGYGESIDTRPQIMSSYRFALPNEPELTTEFETGLRATFGTRVDATLSYARTDVSGGALIAPFLGPTTPATDIDWRVDAAIARVSVRSALGSARPWRAAFSAMKRDHSLTKPFVEFVTLPTDVVGSLMRNGAPIDQLSSPLVTWTDANDDGIISPSETVSNPGWSTVGNSEPRLVLTFDGDIEPWRGIRLGAVVEARLGMQGVDQYEYFSCLIGACPALYDSTASLDEQGAAVAADEHFAVSGIVHDADFARVREVFIEASPRFLRGARIRLAAHQLLAWSAFPRVDPEARVRYGAIGGGVVNQQHPLYPSVSLRIDFDR